MSPTTTIASHRRASAPVEVLDRAVAAVEVAAAAEVEAAGWEDKKLYTEGISTLAGPGAPLVAEFAVVEFAGRLGGASRPATL